MDEINAFSLKSLELKLKICTLIRYGLLDFKSTGRCTEANLQRLHLCPTSYRPSMFKQMCRNPKRDQI